MFNVKIEGLDALQQDLEEATRALESVDGSIGQVSFDPADPRSIEDAVRKMEELVDRRTGHLAAGSLAQKLVAKTKAALADNIRAAARDRAKESPASS